MKTWHVVVDDPTLPRYECEVRTTTKTGARLKAAQLALRNGEGADAVAPQLKCELEKDGEDVILTRIGNYATVKPK